MKKKVVRIFTMTFLLSFCSHVSAQTSGNLTFTYNQPQPTSPALNAGIKNILAVWIENSAGTFIKTRYRFVGNSTTDHLPTWTKKSGGTSNALATTCNVTDAITGATRTTSSSPTAYGLKTITWDGKDVVGKVNGNVVPDGDYKVWIESTWVDSGSNNHQELVSFTFTKGPNAVHLTPTGDKYINSVVLDWVPLNLGIDDNVITDSMASVYPNPSNGIFNINFDKPIHKVIASDLSGKAILEKNIALDSIESSTSIDLSGFENGIYIITVSNNSGESSTYKVVLKK